jgi:hypothetical protein
MRYLVLDGDEVVNIVVCDNPEHAASMGWIEEPEVPAGEARPEIGGKRKPDGKFDKPNKPVPPRPKSPDERIAELEARIAVLEEARRNRI